MNWYQAILWGTSVRHPFVANRHDLKGLDEDRLWAGVNIEEWNERSFLEASDPEQDGVPDDVLQCALGVPVFSARLVNVVETEPIRGAQLLPVQVRRSNGTPLIGFALVNVLAVDGALNLGRSQYCRFEETYFQEAKRGMIRDLRQPVLKQTGLHDVDMVRVREFPHALFVNDRFRNRFEQLHCAGFAFRPVAVSG